MTLKSMAEAIVESQKAHARKGSDFYPTPSDATQCLLDHLRLPRGTRIKEPACGDGAMARVFVANGFSVDASDLRVESGYGRGGVNYLTDPGVPSEWVITNPPFNVALEFLHQALRETGNVALLLKSQFWHARKRIETFEAHPPAEILPLTWRPAFLEAERGKSPLMDVMWVVWRQGDTRCRYRPLRRPDARRLTKPDFDGTDASDLFDIPCVGQGTATVAFSDASEHAVGAAFSGGFSRDSAAIRPPVAVTSGGGPDAGATFIDASDLF